MITREAFFQIAEQAREALLHYHLHDALHLITILLPETDSPSIARDIEAISRDYSAMMDFLANGGKDPSQSVMQCSMVQRTFLHLNNIEAKYRSALHDDYLGQCQQAYEKLQSADASNKEWNFYHALCEPSANIANDDEWFFRTKDMDGQALKMLVAGTTLSLWNYLDPNKLKALCFEARRTPNALIGVVLTLIRHEVSLPLFPEAEKVVAELLSEGEMQSWLAQINHDIFLSSQTEYFDNKIKNELMPILYKGVQDESLRMGFSMDEDEDDAFEKLLKSQSQAENTELSKKKKQIQSSALELLNLQKEGADVGIDLFVNAMSHSFFQDMAHWFLPFDTHHSSIHDMLYRNGKPNPLMKLLLREESMCDIDRYALVLLMSKSMSGSMLDMIQEISSQVAGAEAIAGADYEIGEKTTEQEINGCIKTFYRLFAKSRWKRQMHNPFNDTLNLLDNKYLAPALTNNTEHLLKMAKAMNKYGQPAFALSYLQKINTLEGATSETLQLMADCQQKTGKYRQAVNTLIQADVLTPDNTWILTQLTNCYIQLENQEEQLECLLRLESLVPDSAKITAQTGLCLMKSGRYQEASQRFYKLELEGKQLIPSMRAIAWCAFKQKKYETALRYYKKIFNETGMSVGSVFSNNNMNCHTSLWADYLNAGHTAWMLDDMLSAQSFYHKYTELYLADDPKRTNALAPFDKDKDELLMHGKSEHDIDLMHDIILYRC